MNNLYGVIGIFNDPEELLAAAKNIQRLGYTKVEAFSPFPVKDLDPFMPRTWNPVAGFCLAGGIVGGLSGFFMQYYANVYDYPLNVGGRPLNSWPAFIPITFEMTILFAAFSAVFSMLIINGFPKPYHPIFNSKKFSLGSGDQFCLCIKAKDKIFQLEMVKNILQMNRAQAVEEIEL